MEEKPKGVSFAPGTKVGNESLSDSTSSSVESETEIKAIYSLISARFSKTVTTLEEASDIFNTFIGDYYKVRGQLEKLRQENLDFENQIISADQKDASELLKRKVKRFKARIQDLEKQLAETEQERDKAKENEEKQTILAENERRKNQRLESELECIKRQLEIAKSDNHESKESQPISLLEELLESQNKEISQISEQRDRVIKQLHNIYQVVAKTEEELQELKSQKDNLEQYKQSTEKKLSLAKKELPELAHQVDELIPDEVHDMLEYEDGIDPSNFILSTVKALVATTQKKEEQVVQTPGVQTITADEKYGELLGKLEDAMRFILTSSTQAEHDSSRGLASDSNVQTQLLKRCAKFEKFVDENMLNLNISELPSTSSIFDPNSFKEQEQRLKAFLQDVPKEQLEEGPIRELFVLFSAITEVNSRLISKIESMKDIVKQAENLRYHNETLRKLQRENEEIKRDLEDKTHKLNVCSEAIGKNLGAQDANIDEMIPKFVDIFVQTREENEKHKKEIEQLNTKLQEVTTAKQQSEADLQKKVEELQATLKTKDTENQKLKNDHHEAVSELFAEKEELNEKLQTSQEDNTKNVKRLTKKIKKLSTQLSQSERNVNELRQTTDRMTDDNGKLVTQNDDMRATIKKQSEQILSLQAVEKKLRISREQLKGQLQELQINTAREIQLLKQQVVDSHTESTSKIAELENEIVIQKNINASTEETMEKLTQQKQSLVQANTKLRILERTLRLKIAQMEEAQQLEKNVTEARESTYFASLKAQAAKQVTEISAQYDEAKNIMVRLLAEKFEVALPENASFTEITALLEEQINASNFDKKVLSDANKLRMCLKLQKDELLSTVYDELKQRYTEATQEVKEQRSQIETLSRDLEQTKVNAKKASDLAKEVMYWENWARATYYQISDGASANTSIKEIKEILEESLLGNIDQKTTIRRMDILRAEKKMLSSRHIADELFTPGGKVTSVRPLLVALVFLHRTQTMSFETNLSNAERGIALECKH